jgi:hypothetical protein
MNNMRLCGLDPIMGLTTEQVTAAFSLTHPESGKISLIPITSSPALPLHENDFSGIEIMHTLHRFRFFRDDVCLCTFHKARPV